MMNVPSYADWLEKTDQTLAYTYMVKLLKYLQWKSPQKRWILKTPHHLEFMDLIEKHFDDVHFLWMHRNVYDSIPSFLSMVAYNRMIFSKKVDEKVVARHWLRKNGYMLQKALQYRLKAGNESKFTDINYSHLIENSLNELSHIYKMNGGLKPELVNSFSKSEKENPFRKYGVHKYAMDDFGLTGNDITMHTSQYQEFIRETSILRT
jgi:hypothetical protein